MNLQKIVKPSLIIDKEKAINNIRKMKAKALESNVIFRPHFKTHQSKIVAEWFKTEGISKITVSSVSMAKFFANEGWNDISIAFPLNIREFDEIEQLSQSINLNLLISSEIHAEFLSKNNRYPTGVFIKIDTGYHRAGIQHDNIAKIDHLLSILGKNKSLKFNGLISHFGNTYHAKNQNEILEIYLSGVNKLNTIKNYFVKDYPDLLISIGDTPSCSIVEQFDGIDEIRPGNFVYHDLTQYKLGVCEEEQISVAVACPVIDVYPDRNEILIYGGAVHLSKDYITDNLNIKSFGSIVYLSETGWGKSIPGTFIKTISQEHGIISYSSECIPNIKIGELIGVLPVHSCLSADLLEDTFILE